MTTLDLLDFKLGIYIGAKWNRYDFRLYVDNFHSLILYKHKVKEIIQDKGKYSTCLTHWGIKLTGTDKNF